MRIIVGFILILLVQFNFTGSLQAGESLPNLNLIKSGDIILISLKCYYCSIIESETNSNYSHIGMILKEEGEIKVIDSMGKVQITKLDDFIKRTTPKSKITFLRHFEFNKSGISSQKLRRVVEEKYLNLPYDPYFLLNNKINNQTALYCSELVEELISEFTNFTEGYFPLTYQKNFEIWKKYFDRLDYHVPEGVLGSSPVSFARSSFYNKVLEFEKEL